MYRSKPSEKYDTPIKKCPHEQKFTKMQIIRIAFTWWQRHFISRLYEALLVDKINEQFNYASATRSSLPADRFHTETSGRFAFTSYLWEIFVPEWYSRSGTTTGVNSRQCDSRRYSILCWYHVNKYRATRGNRSELAPAQKSSRCHVNTLEIRSIVKTADKPVK